MFGCMPSCLSWLPMCGWPSSRRFARRITTGWWSIRSSLMCRNLFGPSELWYVAEPVARIAFGCWRRRRTARALCCGFAERFFVVASLSWTQESSWLHGALPGAWACNACKLFFAHQGFVVGHASKRSLLAIEHISDEFCRSSASKKGDTLQHAAFVFTRGLRRLGTSSCF